MTVATKTRSWQERPARDVHPPAMPPAAPSLFPLRAFLLERWGGANLSVDDLVHCRPIVDGDELSSHCGCAFDWRYEDPGPGRRVMLNEILPFLIGNSLELNVQQVHDYVGCRIWKAKRAGDANGGWKTQPEGQQMGKPWALWLHIEAGEWGWSDGRQVVERLGLGGQVTVDFERDGGWGLWPFARKRELTVGDKGDDVKYLQSVIKHRAGGGVVIDGDFSELTEMRVRDVQGVFGFPGDGKCGPRTWTGDRAGAWHPTPATGGIDWLAGRRA